MSTKDTRIVVALPAEAKPVYRHFGLVRDNRAEHYPLYRSGEVTLIVTGIGSEAAADATRWLCDYQPVSDQTRWINLGIAGHPALPIGEALLAHTVSNAEGGEQICIDLPHCRPCDTAPLITRNKPELEYSAEALFDMEAYGFLSAVLETSLPGQAQCLKIISDNRENPVKRINAKLVQELIEQRLGTLGALISLMEPDSVH
jgi:adenosylhomocysteine nucleosidase